MNWTKKTIGEIFEIENGSVQTGPFGSQLHESDYKAIGTPVIMPKDIIKDKINVGSIARISDEDVQRLARHKVKVNDIVFPRRGEIGKRVLIDESTEGYLCGTGCIRLRGSGEIINPKFLYYYFKQKHIVKWIENQAIGATMLNLNTSILKSVPIVYPNDKINQVKIVSIISTYDDLIENNNQRIHLLEEMAEEIYKEWFIRMRFPNYRNTKFFDKKGKEVLFGTEEALPNGWKIIEFKDIIQLVSGFAFKSADFTNTPQEKLVIRMGNFKIKGGLKFDKNIKFLKEGVKVNEKYRLSKEDLLMVLSDVTRDGAIIGNVGLVPSDDSKIFYLNQRVSKLDFDRKYQYYLYQYFNSIIFKNYCLAHADSATVLNLSNKDLYKHKMILPTNIILNSFEKIIKPMRDEIEILIKKNKVLQQTRNLLLPRLISGKLNIKEVTTI